MTNVICYMHDDLDGYASANIVKNVYQKAYSVLNIEFIKVQYGDDTESKIDITKFNKNTIIVIVDFTFTQGLMDKLIDMKLEKEILNLVWIDHHKSAKEKMPNLWNIDSVRINGLRELDNGSAALLTWKLYHIGENIPKALDYISRYDTWDFGENEVEIKEFIMGLNLSVADSSPNEHNSRTLELLLDGDNETFDTIYSSGNSLYRDAISRIKKSIADGKEITFHGHKAFIVNSNHDISLMGETIYDKGYDIAIIWSIRNNNAIFSLRSKTVDVSAIAKLYDGGGHKGAAGFTLKSEYPVWKFKKEENK